MSFPGSSIVGLLSEDVVIALNNGEKTAFESCYLRYGREMYAYSTNILSEQQDAEDIVADTFEKLWKHRKEIETPVHLRNWLYFTTRNAILNHLRSRNVCNKNILLLQQLNDDIWQETRSLRSELLTRIYEEIQRLPLVQKEILILHFIKGFPLKKIAEIKACSDITVRNNKLKAMANLKKKLLNDPHFREFLAVLLLSICKSIS